MRPRPKPPPRRRTWKRWELKGYLYDKVIANYGPIGPCECNCPEPCLVDEAATVKKLGEATGSMRILGTQLQELFDSDAADEFYGLA